MRPTIICGPSGVGKRKLIEKLKAKVPDTFGVAVSHTTRPRRPTEVHGTDYYFVDKEQFENAIKENKFVEYVLYANEYYGTSLEAINAIRDKRLVCILDIDVFGAEKINNEQSLDCNYLFITTSKGVKTLKKRMMQRKTESTEEINRRLETAKIELAFLQNNPNFFDSVIYNDQDIDESWFNLKEQFVAMYPDLKRKIYPNDSNNKHHHDTDDDDDDDDDDDTEDLSNIFRINSVSKRQSVDLYANLSKSNNVVVVTQESLCKDIIMKHTPLDLRIINIVIEYTDIPPMNRRKQWKMNEFQMILNKVTSSVQHRWTLGNSVVYCPIINANTIGDIYFAYHEKVINGVLFYLCGTVKCPVFAKKYFKARIEHEKDWDKCWEIYFYMKCDSEYRGSVQFSTRWSNMVIFGIDNDAIREAVENGIWKLNTMQSNNFLIKPYHSSIPSSTIEDDDDQIIDED